MKKFSERKQCNYARELVGVHITEQRRIEKRREITFTNWFTANAQLPKEINNTHSHTEHLIT